MAIERSLEKTKIIKGSLLKIPNKNKANAGSEFSKMVLDFYGPSTGIPYQYT